MIKLFLVWILNHKNPINYMTKQRIMLPHEFKQQTKFEKLVTTLQSMQVKASLVKRPTII